MRCEWRTRRGTMQPRLDNQLFGGRGGVAVLRGARVTLAWSIVLAASGVVGPIGERTPLVAAPSKPAADRDLRTYRFTARVTDNGGVTPFKAGAVVKGTVTYDLRGKDRLPDHTIMGQFE